MTKQRPPTAPSEETTLAPPDLLQVLDVVSEVLEQARLDLLLDRHAFERDHDGQQTRAGRVDGVLGVGHDPHLAVLGRLELDVAVVADERPTTRALGARDHEELLVVTFVGIEQRHRSGHPNGGLERAG